MSRHHRSTRHRVVGGRVVEVPAGACIYCVAEREGRPVFHCALCGRHIGRRSVCLMDAAGTVWCMTCRLGDGSSAWWDAHPPLAWGSQAGVRAYLRELAGGVT